MKFLLVAYASLANVLVVAEDTGVVVTVTYPYDGAEVNCPFAPQLDLEVDSSGSLVDRIRNAPSEVGKAHANIPMCTLTVATS